MAGLVEQLDAFETGAGIVRLPGRTQLEIAGADRAKFLTSFCTGDIKSLLPGDGCEAFVTSIQGKTLAHILVFCREESLLVDTVPNQAQFLIDHLDKYLFSDDVEFIDQSEHCSTLLLAGPSSANVLKTCFESDVPSETLQHVEFDCGSIRRGEMLGPDSFLISVKSDSADGVCAKLQSAKAIPCEEEAYQARRIQFGWPDFGRDITDENLPQEVDRNEQAVCFTKGCYLGQETVARIDAMGHVNRRLVGLMFKDQTNVEPPVELSNGDKVVGKVTSAAFHPGFESVIALGYVRQAHAKSGNVFSSPAGDVEVVELPLAVEV